MTLFAQCPAEKMSSSAGFHANQSNLQVRGEVQELAARKPLAHYNLSAQVTFSRTLRVFLPLSRWTHAQTRANFTIRLGSNERTIWFRCIEGVPKRAAKERGADWR